MKIEVWIKPVHVLETESTELYEAILPVRASEKAAGYDVATPYPLEIKPGDQRLINTGLIFKMPDGYHLDIRPRSGLSVKNSIHIPNSPGTLDADYCGPNDTLKICLRNTGGKTLSLQRGDRIAQVMAIQTEPMEFSVQEGLPDGGDRGGFGSTGGIAKWL